MSELLSIEEFACLVGTRRVIIEEMVQWELLEPVDATGPHFSCHIVERARLIVRLHVQLEVSWSSMELVLNLLERIEQLEGESR